MLWFNRQWISGWKKNIYISKRRLNLTKVLHCGMVRLVANNMNRANVPYCKCLHDACSPCTCISFVISIVHLTLLRVKWMADYRQWGTKVKVSTYLWILCCSSCHQLLGHVFVHVFSEQLNLSRVIPGFAYNLRII